MMEENSKYKKQKTYFESYQKYYKRKISYLLKQFNLELVVYDEEEQFRMHNHGLFMYPYTPRKNLINSYKFKIQEFDDADYSYYQAKLKF